MLFRSPATQFPAVVSGTGLEGGITGGAPNIGGTVGTYSIDGVPTNTREQLTVSVTAYQFDEAGTFPPDEIPLKSDPFTATNNGTGVYRVDTIAAGGGN